MLISYNLRLLQEEMKKKYFCLRLAMTEVALLKISHKFVKLPDWPSLTFGHSAIERRNP